jgi:acylphosphatase
MDKLGSIKVIIHGRVQGVFFRASTRRVARELGLSGTVRNLPGWQEVEVQAEGDTVQLKKLIEFLKTGPSGAKVENVDIEWLKYAGRYNEFNVIY